MRPYEVMIILDPALEESSIRDQVDRSTELIRASGGTPGRVDQWGRRRLAYEIDHHREGYYILVEATAEPGALDALDRALHLSDEVLRHKVIRLPDRIAGRTSKPAPPPPPALEPDPRPPAPIAAAPAASDSDSGTPTNGA